jgi:hypothetical protein
MTASLSAKSNGTQGALQVNGVDAVVFEAGGIVSGFKDNTITPAKLTQPMTLATAVNTTVTGAVDFVGIPSWVKKITFSLAGVNSSDTGAFMLQLGSGSIQTSGYSGGMWYSTGGAANSAGAQLAGRSAGEIQNGNVTLVHLGGNVWEFNGCGYTTGPGLPWVMGGRVTLSGVLDRLRFTNSNSSNLFNAGTVNILYEG